MKNSELRSQNVLSYGLKFSPESERSLCSLEWLWWCSLQSPTGTAASIQRVGNSSLRAAAGLPDVWWDWASTLNLSMWRTSLFCTAMPITATCQDRSTGVAARANSFWENPISCRKSWGVPVTSPTPGPTAGSETTACPEVCNQTVRGCLCDGEGRWVDLTWLSYF